MSIVAEVRIQTSDHDLTDTVSLGSFECLFLYLTTIATPSYDSPHNNLTVSAVYYKVGSSSSEVPLIGAVGAAPEHGGHQLHQPRS